MAAIENHYHRKDCEDWKRLRRNNQSWVWYAESQVNKFFREGNDQLANAADKLKKIKIKK